MAQVQPKTQKQKREEFNNLLEEALGSTNVYFQPPENIKMQYPAIVYNRSYAVTQYADNAPYTHAVRYSVTLIDKNPDSSTYDKLAFLPKSSFDRSYKADGLNHDIFNIYF